LDVSDLAKRTLAAWPAGDFILYVDVADKLGEIPWDVQEACYRLVEMGLMVAGEGSNRGTFRKV
jgi:hypothetical protein